MGVWNVIPFPGHLRVYLMLRWRLALELGHVLDATVIVILAGKDQQFLPHVAWTKGCVQDQRETCRDRRKEADENLTGCLERVEQALEILFLGCQICPPCR